MVIDKLQEHMYDEIEYYALRSNPIMMDKQGSKVPQQVWKSNGIIKAEFINKNSDNCDFPPLKKFFDRLENDVNNSRDMVSIQTKIRQSSIENVEDEIYERFFTKEFQIQTIEGEDYHYIGTVNQFGKPEGIGRIVFSNNGFYEGAFKNGRATGYGRRIEPNGSIFNGLYFQDIR